MKLITKSNVFTFFSIITCCLLLPIMQGCSPINKVGTPPAVSPESTALDEPGEFAVKQLDTRFRNDRGNYNATLYYPDSAGTYPAIAFSPGLGAVKGYYRWVGNHLASHGYMVLIFTVPMPFTTGTTQHQAGFVSAFEWLEAENNNAASPVYGQIDLNHRGIMGHSLGGAGASRAAQTMDIDAVVALAPGAPGDLVQDIRTATTPVNLKEAIAAGLATITAPIQIQAATQDCITGDLWDAAYYQALTAPSRQFILINGGNHVSFNDAGSLADTGGQAFDCKAVIDTVDHHQRLSRRYFTAWFDYFLKNDATVLPYIFGDQAEQDLASELITALEFASP
ncbi:MAG TPA: hypothetical protein VM553_06120 [Dongiaceae bacterium]|nr:hypothetical protein [Dongiaceae bacterium]